MRVLKKYDVNTNVPGSVDAKTYCELSGKSTETKPTAGVADGSICLESDTGKIFFFNEVDAVWVEQFTFKTVPSDAEEK